MGKMKNLVIDQMNKDRNGPDDTDWNAPPNQLEPPPDMINTETGKSMWIIKDYRIWAETYKQALELLPLIESI
jgi:hypothetical protein